VTLIILVCLNKPSVGLYVWVGPLKETDWHNHSNTEYR